MDYIKVPLAKRTRLQQAKFYKELHESRKSAETSTGNKDRKASSTGSGGVGNSGSVSGSVFESSLYGIVKGDGVNVSVKEGYGSVGFEGDEILGTKRGLKPRKGLKEKNKNVVSFHGDSKTIRKHSRQRNLVKIGGVDGVVSDSFKTSVEFKKCESSHKKSKKQQNVASFCGDSKVFQLFSGQKDVVKIGGGDDRVVEIVETTVDSKRNKYGPQKLKKKKEVEHRGVEDGGDDDVQYLGTIMAGNLARDSMVGSKSASLENESALLKVLELDGKPSSGKRTEREDIQINDGGSKKRKEVIRDISTKSEDGNKSSFDHIQEVRELNTVGPIEVIDSFRSCDSTESELSSEKDILNSSDEKGYEEGNYSSSVSSDGSCSSIMDEYEVESVDGEEEEKNVQDEGVDTKGKEGMGKVKRGRVRHRKIVFSDMSSSGSEKIGKITGLEMLVQSDKSGGEKNEERKSIDSVDGKANEFVGKVKSVRGRPRKIVVSQRSSSNGEKIRKVHGLVILADSVKDGGEGNEGPKSIAERVRRRSRCSNSEKEHRESLGTVSCPFALTDDEFDCSSKDKDKAADGDTEAFANKGSDRKSSGKVAEKSKGKSKRYDKRSRNSAKAVSISVDKILADSIWEEGDRLLENLASGVEKVPDQIEDITLPLKFRFEDENLKPPDKSSWDILAEELFAEMDFALAACENNISKSAEVDNEDGIVLETETDPAAHCHQGNHQLVLDEQIGLKCKFCSFVTLEIGNILPPFIKHRQGRLEEKYSGLTDHIHLNELQFLDSDSAYQSGLEPDIHPKGTTVWDLIPGIKDRMYPHQREGFEFIWENLAGGIELEKLSGSSIDGGSGCIISHAPGTGKTRLTILFLETYMKLNQRCRPVIVAPSSMLLTWEEEFHKCNVDITFHNLNKLEFSGKENATAVNLLKKAGYRGQKPNLIRMVKMYSWKKDRSVLGISYVLFEQLAGLRYRGRKNTEVKHSAINKEIGKMLFKLPGLLVLDEGHTPRNDGSFIWKAISRVETRRRIILSGTPFQNNFDELFNTLCLVRPEFADKIISKTHWHSGRKHGRKNGGARGNWALLTSSIHDNNDDKLEELRNTIKSFVHVYKGTILKDKLPGLRDSLVVLRPTEFQKAIIEVIQRRKNPFELDHLVTLISVHPSLLLSETEKLNEEEKLSVDLGKLEILKYNPEAGVKTKFIIELVRLSEAMKEKVLVFSQYLDSLDFIKERLKSYFHWTEGKEVLYMDGKLGLKHRQYSISCLNDPESEVRVLLASTKACSEGINLVGASRVILLDVVWNPSVERQAISRAYRLGQKKVVYVYHLITSGTWEGEKYVRQVEKDRLSELVFSPTDSRVDGPIFCAVGEDKILQEMVQNKKTKSIFEKILNQPKEANLIDTFGGFVS